MRQIVGLILILTISIIINNPAYSNDTALSATGDTVGPFKGTPPVVLEQEFINLDVYNEKTMVTVIFHLKNEGPAQDILVGFPDEYGSMQLPENSEYEIGNYMGPIENFKVYVNNVEVRADKKPQEPKEIVDSYPKDFKVLWYVWPVHFKAGAKVIIKNTYWAKNGIDVLNQKNFNYTLITGKKWKGPIGCTKVYLRFRNGLNVNDIIKEHTTKGMTIVNRQRAMWEFKNFEPNQETGFFRLYFKKNLIPAIKTRNLVEGDLHGLTPWELKVLRNEIYARHGRPFKSGSLDSYFRSFEWYKVNQHYSDKMLNYHEKRNANYILQYEKKIGSKEIYTD